MKYVCLCVCLFVPFVKFLFRGSLANQSTVLDYLTNQRTVLDELYQLKSIQFRPIKCNVVSLSTPFHFRYHKIE